ncbi:MAG: hypothetical protein AAFZ18_05520 [Myxococcota bacterium]
MRTVPVAAVLTVSLALLPLRGRAQATGDTVPTFYGLRRLEQDSKVADDEKVRAWAAFIERARKQIAYAEKAKDRWKNAAKYRLVESARLAEKDPTLGFRQRVAQWEAVVSSHPEAPEAKAAKERAAYWRSRELTRLVEAAEKVEGEGAFKVGRIRAWLAVAVWSPESRPGQAARKRIDALQKQLFTEAETIDGMKRLDDRLRLEAWQDVLRGDPTPAQRAKAEARVKALGGD